MKGEIALEEHFAVEETLISRLNARRLPKLGDHHA